MSKRTEYLSLRLPDELKVRIRKLGKAEGRSLNDMTIVLLYLAAHIREFSLSDCMESLDESHKI